MATTRDIEGIPGSEPDEPTIKTGKNFFLGIGIDKYQHFSPLKNAVKDIQDVAKLLIDEFGFEQKEPYFTILINEEATRKNIILSLRKIVQQAKEEDRVLIYYSGHGFLDKVTDRGYWIPVSAAKEDDSAYVSNSDIRDYIKAMDSRHTLLISDSCFSGSLLVRSAETGESAAFDQWESNKSRWLFSSGKGVVADGQVGTNSPFASQIIKQLSSPSANKINISDLANKVIKNVRFNYDQQAEASPFFGAGHEGGQFIFYKNVNTEEQEKADYEALMQSQNNRELINFLKRVRNVDYKKDIQKRLHQLEQDQADAWNKVNKESWSALDQFIDQFPYSSYAMEASRLQGTLETNPMEEAPPIMKVPIPPTPPPSSSGFSVKEQKQLIAENKMRQVFKNLDAWAETPEGKDSGIGDSLILLQSRYNQLLQKSRQGIISSSNENIEKNRITHALLSLLDEI